MECLACQREKAARLEEAEFWDERGHVVGTCRTGWSVERLAELRKGMPKETPDEKELALMKIRDIMRDADSTWPRMFAEIRSIIDKVIGPRSGPSV
jgi:hypothetical protein